MNLSEWKERNKKAKKYAHFDTRTTLDNVWSYISNPIKVEKHSFYPFIHYEKNFNKFKDGKVIPKCRELCYSAHIDRYIFSYYGYLLNEKYNQILADKGIEEVAIAYRNNLFKNNIHFAKKAFDTIRKLEKCYIMIGDFTSFFDQLDHMYLKERLCEVLEVEKLPPDYYAVYKNITKYAKVELEHLLMINNLPINDRGIEELKSKKQVLTLTEFRKAKRANPKFITKNQKGYGIPQGSAISAVLSNIYMIKYDEQINQLVTKRGGTYLRYSDDFIIILPGTQEDFREVYGEIECIRKSVPRLDLQKEKTQIFIYNEKELKNINSFISV